MLYRYCSCTITAKLVTIMSLTPHGYLPRIADASIERALKSFAAVEIKGSKFCGKTWSSLAHGESIVHLDDRATREMAQLDPTLALDGTCPHVIDEWQDVPDVWDAVRRRVDACGNTRGQFLLTGSSTIDMTLVSHSGAGRIACLTMRPMTLFESGDSDGTVSLKGLFDGMFTAHAVQTDVRALAHLICRGGWPASIGDEEEFEQDLPSQYLDALFNVSAVRQGIDGRRARRIAVSIARNIGKTVTYKTLDLDAAEGETPSDISSSAAQQRIAPYVDFFKDQFFIEDQDGWDAPIKSRSRVRKKPKRSFADPSLPASLLGMSPERLLRETQTFGTLFEEMCLRDLRVYASSIEHFPDPVIRYYADADGLEVDAIIELKDGRWGAFEIKLSDDKVPEAERNLLRLKRKIAANPSARNRDPSFLAVLVGKAHFARMTSEGVYVVPITSLGC